MEGSSPDMHERAPFSEYVHVGGKGLNLIEDQKIDFKVRAPMIPGIAAGFQAKRDSGSKRKPTRKGKKGENKEQNRTFLNDGGERKLDRYV